MDNKYANLPGIARNEPDFYETTNIIISNEKQDTWEDDSTSVHKINISPLEAHDKFNSIKGLNSDFVDFSDTVTNRRKFGYRVESDAYEWNLEAAETPIQRFKRLERELKELKQDLNEMNNLNAAEENQMLTIFNPMELAKQVEGLQKQVNLLHLEAIGAKVDPMQADTKSKKQLLLDHLNESKKYLNETKGKTKENILKSSETSIVFKLFRDLESDEMARANKISDLNQRLLNLEKTFGAGNSSFDERQLNILCSSVENKSIMGLVENLNSKLNLIDSQSLDQIESRLHMICQRVNQLNEKKILIEDHEKLSRINEIYQMVVKWKDISSSVPSVVERLSILNDLHQKAFQFPAILSRLDSEQNFIKEKLASNCDLLNQLKSNLEQNLNSINKNFDLLMNGISEKKE